MRWLLLIGLIGTGLLASGFEVQGGETEADRARCKVRIGGSGWVEQPWRRLGYDGVDHTALDHLLGQFVDCHGMVCYRAWKESQEAVGRLQGYLDYLGRVDTRAPGSRSAKLAFWINAYNALTLWGILRDYPTASIQLLNRTGACYRIFDDLELWVDGEYYSLNRIEHRVLRPMKEPRIHFALVCAARGCPRLRNEVYDPTRLDEQLNDNARDFFASSKRFHVCRLTGAVKLSPLLSWYGLDFGASDPELLAAIFPHLPWEARTRLAQRPGWKIKYLGYDWGLNDRCPPAGMRIRERAYSLYSRAEPVIRPFLRAVR